MVFLNNKNIIFNRSSYKLDYKKLSLFKIIDFIKILYYLKLSLNIRIYNVFYLNLLNLIINNLLLE